MLNKKIYINGSEIGNIDKEDVYNIENPAYVVKQIEKEKGGGCVVAWNKEFERLTNFEPWEIDNAPCYEIFEGAQRREKKKDYVRICCEGCKFRTSGIVGNAYVLRNFWINSKYVKGLGVKYIKRRVDIYIFPFESETERGRFALHILIDKGGVHAYKYFEETFMIRSEEGVRNSIQPLLKEAQYNVDILEGFEKARTNIDEIFNLIKTSTSIDKVRQQIMSQFSLTALQSDAILEMEFKGLTMLKKEEIEEGRKQLRNKINEYNTILSNQNMIQKIIEDDKEDVKVRCSKKEMAENKARLDLMGGISQSHDFDMLSGPVT